MNWSSTFLMIYGSTKRPTSCCLDMLRAKTAHSGGTAVPNEVLQRPLQSKKCKAWAVMSKHGIIGPFWFEDEDKEPLIVMNKRYIEVLQQYWTALGLRNRGRGPNMSRRDRQWFQQDDATPRSANVSLKWSVGNEIPSGYHICLTWAPQTSTYEDNWKIMYVRRILK